MQCAMKNLNQEILLYKHYIQEYTSKKTTQLQLIFIYSITSNQKLKIVFILLSTSLYYYIHVVEARVTTYKHHRLIYHQLIVDIIALLVCYFSVRIDRYTLFGVQTFLRVITLSKVIIFKIIIII